MRPNSLRAFTIVEMLAVLGAIALLVGLLIPTMRSFRESAGETNCASNLKQLGMATIAYRAAYKDHLPQVGVDFTGDGVNDALIGALFGGKRGSFASYGIDQVGANKRPLNKFLDASAQFADWNVGDQMEDVPVYRCPLDRGQPEQGAPGDPAYSPSAESLYDLVGTSYTLNDRPIEGNAWWTLIPQRTPACPSSPDPNIPQKIGGRVPFVEDATKTWMIGDHPIYNYELDPIMNPNVDADGNRNHKHLWHYERVRCNLCFVDGHVGTGIEISPSAGNTTKKYTFLPTKDWMTPENCANNCMPPPPP
ncbi:MAG: DUF1559 domain-containing protein [Phycisphaerales bacterium]|nr:DUF1559 domain-containing protein [Phycisphaerales bacterium]